MHRARSERNVRYVMRHYSKTRPRRTMDKREYSVNKETRTVFKFKFVSKRSSNKCPWPSDIFFRSFGFRFGRFFAPASVYAFPRYITFSSLIRNRRDPDEMSCTTRRLRAGPFFAHDIDSTFFFRAARPLVPRPINRTRPRKVFSTSRRRHRTLGKRIDYTRVDLSYGRNGAASTVHASAAERGGDDDGLVFPYPPALPIHHVERAGRACCFSIGKLYSKLIITARAATARVR